jgi:phosphatidylglycerol:prolipoprotein diacylglycerol transferase
MRPILFHIGPLPVFSFGTMVALGLLLTIYLISRRARKTGFPSGDTAVDSVYVAVAGGFFGARLLYIAQNLPFYLQNPLKVFALWEGGLIFYGGVAGALAGLWFFSRVKKLSFPALLDFLIPFEVLTHAFGRLGCFLNGCCYGEACDLPWAVEFTGSGGPVHPVQLYEAAALFALFLFLNYRYTETHPFRSKVEGGRSKFYSFLPPSTFDLRPPRKSFDGETLALYFVLYGIIRFCMELFRENPSLGILTYNQWLSILIAGAGIAFWKWKGKKSGN